MAKTNRTPSHKQQFEDEYEDFGYDVKNARRYQSNKKRTPKFRDYNEYEDSWRSVTLVVVLPLISCIVCKSIKPTPFMRKIEEQMCNAVHHNIDWKNANTSVTYCEESGESKVFLHGNHIATVGDDFLQIFDGGWQSNTTKSRLNSLINRFCNGMTDGVHQHKFEWFIRDNNVTREFENGYIFAWYMHYCMPYLPTGVEYQPRRKMGFFIVYKLTKMLYNAVK